ncbi:MAG TPA: DUF4392 domain-containing protein [Clostridia bacterium]|nr:DUF4392 domain-containing protein [Clostridia bacterium]
MERFFDDISSILSRDPGNRGLMPFLPKPDPSAAYHAFEGASRALIVTGFPIRAQDGRVCCETDGPPGAADMAYALAACNVATSVATDETSFPQVRAAVDCRAPGVRTYLVKKGDAAAARRLINDLAPTHVIPIERPGKGADGRFHSSRGAVIDDWLADTDLVYSLARQAGAVAIAIGDGGNELGTGAHRAAVSRLLPGGDVIAAKQDADVTLMTGVSNWWGWGVAALLSARVGRDLLPSAAQEIRLMRTLLEAGAADGITKQPAMSVDGLSLEENLAVLEELRGALKRYLAGRIRDERIG